MTTETATAPVESAAPVVAVTPEPETSVEAATTHETPEVSAPVAPVDEPIATTTTTSATTDAASPKAPKRSPFSDLKNKYFSPKVNSAASTGDEPVKETVVGDSIPATTPATAESAKENVELPSNEATETAGSADETKPEETAAPSSPKAKKAGVFDKLKALLEPKPKEPKEAKKTADKDEAASATTPVDETANATIPADDTAVATTTEAPVTVAQESPKVTEPAAGEAKETTAASTEGIAAVPEASPASPEVKIDAPSKPKKEKTPNDLAKLGRRLSAKLPGFGGAKKDKVTTSTEKPSEVSDAAPKIDTVVDESPVATDEASKVEKAEEAATVAPVTPVTAVAPSSTTEIEPSKVDEPSPVVEAQAVAPVVDAPAALTPEETLAKPAAVSA